MKRTTKTARPVPPACQQLSAADLAQVIGGDVYLQYPRGSNGGGG